METKTRPLLAKVTQSRLSYSAHSNTPLNTKLPQNTFNMPKEKSTTATTRTKRATKEGGRKKKDPNQPKRGLSAYMFFANEQRDKVREDNPGIKFGEEWKSLNDKQKEPYDAKAKADKQRYEEEKAA